MDNRKLNPKVKKLADRARADEHIKNAEKKAVVLKNWHKHVEERHEIASYSTIIDDKLYLIEPQKDEVILPFTEYHGDHSENWIIIVNIKTNQEINRKNTKTVDMVYWKLSPSSTKPKSNG